MSELIQKHDSRATIRWKLLTGASAMALTAYVASTALARAEDTDRPTLWIELGGQMEMMQGLSSPFTAPFMSITPTPDIYKLSSFTQDQRPPRFAFGGEGKISFQPEDSGWIFSAGIRYGRSHAKRHVHHQTTYGIMAYFHTKYGANTGYPSRLHSALEFVDTKAQHSERHMVLDFSAGKDVGIGLLGRDGTSSISAGVRLLDLTESSTAAIYARPRLEVGYRPPKYQQPIATFTQYILTGHANRSFKGIGPSLSWNASAGLAGNSQDGELMLDWGANVALLFGKQKAKTDHATTATHYGVYGYYSGPIYPPRAAHSTRLRSVTVPNVGGFAGISMKWPNAKVSVGYRADVFLKAMDTGIDVRKDSNLTFNGPYASISIGLGD